ncbi:MAG: ribonuclease III [Clostridiales Family XIII bacterium]|nr:ribonuclease III [Clostridiales Family XIII bacterium]
MDQSYEGYEELSVSALAFIGDGVWEIFVRKLSLSHVPARAASASEKLHAETVKYVKASAQAKAILRMKSSLDGEEAALVRRARNRKPRSLPRNADLMEYKWATAFEALIGYLYLAGRKEELAEAMAAAAKIIEEG